jgi:hypothetical protein
MKKLTKAQKAQFPKYIAYVDFSSKGRDEFDMSTYTRALEQTDLLNAMRHMETCIQKSGTRIYLAEILSQAGEDEETGEPLYKTAIMTRVYGGEDYTDSSNWHFRDEAHGESPSDYYKWYARDNDRHGVLDWTRKSDKE